MNNEVIHYIVRFLIGDETGSDQLLSRIGYTSKQSEMSRYSIVIRASKFFDSDVYGTDKAFPSLPLKEWEGVPLLFGEPTEELLEESDTLVLNADIIASTYFLISRYEEIYRRKTRDAHGRFPGRESLPFKAGFLQRPIVDEYGAILRAKIRQMGWPIKEPAPHFSMVNLTHDVDEPFEYRGWRSFARALIKERKSPFKAFRLAYANPSSDRFFTFPRLVDWDKALRGKMPDRCRIIFFFKTPGKAPQDMPNYSLKKPLYQSLRSLVENNGIVIGLHSNYSAGLNPELIGKQRKQLMSDTGVSVDCNRHHYLAAREPEDMQALISAGIRHDYSMGYADVAGFRLGTSRPVRFIMPSTRRLTELILHPLTLMDCTLDRAEYMGLDEAAATKLCEELLKHTFTHGGEATLLWHNEYLFRDIHPWHARLYREVLRLIETMEEKQENESPDYETATDQ
ncbi:polysaccharide deacetylase family protein [Porphyromonas gulae]|uniref:polysaccharide deacetylase family protein n=1 Tax=Porphyromonas gulae TaxID=111105 RepID=UPI0026EE6070|nr:polysaccharide deacetylase family protein [Porphyromonas gulae]